MRASTRILAAGTLLLAIACGLQMEAADEAQLIIDETAALSTTIGTARTDLDGRLASSAVPNAKALADREALAKAFDEAEAKRAEAQACADGLQLMLERDEFAESDKVMGMNRRCRTLLDRIQLELDKPGTTLSRWESLLSPDSDEVAGAFERGSQASVTIGDAQRWKSRVGEMSNAYPFKAEDLQARYADLLEHGTELDDAIESGRVQKGRIGTDKVDAAELAKAVDTIEENVAIIEYAAGDIDTRLTQLPQERTKVLVQLERIPAYYVRINQWSWSSSTSGDGTVTDLGWQQVSEEVYQAAEDGHTVLETTGSESYDGTSTEIVDWDMGYTAWATTIERIDGLDGDAVRAEIDADTFWDLYTVSTTLHDLFPSQGIVVDRVEGTAKDEDNIPLAVDLTTTLVISQKYPGQYPDEAAQTPSIDGVPITLVGHPDYGQWDGDTWTFAPWFQRWWKTGAGKRSELGNDMVEGGWTKTRHDPYTAWRSSVGWDQQYDSNGRWHVFIFSRGAYRAFGRRGAATLRGAGPAHRSRGLGGGK